MTLVLWLSGLALALAATVALAKIEVKSTGAFHAEGEGTARLMMVKGDATVVVKGKFGITPAETKVTFAGNSGTKEEVKDPKTKKVIGYIYNNVDAMIGISGTEYIATLQGTKIRLDIPQGAGQAMIQGSGGYTSVLGKEKRTGNWSLRSNAETQCIPIPIAIGDVKITEDKPAKSGK